VKTSSFILCATHPAADAVIFTQYFVKFSPSRNAIVFITLTL